MAAKKGSGRTSDRKKASSAQARAKKERMERDKRHCITFFLQPRNQTIFFATNTVTTSGYSFL